VQRWKTRAKSSKQQEYDDFEIKTGNTRELPVFDEKAQTSNKKIKRKRLQSLPSKNEVKS
jgi:hypothetical protein